MPGIPSGGSVTYSGTTQTELGQAEHNTWDEHWRALAFDDDTDYEPTVAEPGGTDSAGASRQLTLGHMSEACCCLADGYLGVPLPWHPEQPHLAEWQAFSAREILFHLDQTVDARNMAQAQAKKRASQLGKTTRKTRGRRPTHAVCS